MEYLLPAQLSAKFEISQKTVYNYLSKYPDEIRIKKEFWKRFVHEKDFEKALNAVQKIRHPNTHINNSKPTPEATFHESEKQIELQNAYNLVTMEKERLEKQNRNLEEQRNNYIKLHREEKEQKNQFIEKYDKLQFQYSEKIESFGKERIIFLRKYYSALLLCVAALLILLIMVLPNVIERLSKN